MNRGLGQNRHPHERNRRLAGRVALLLLGVGLAHGDLRPEDVSVYHSFDGHTDADFAGGSPQNVFRGRVSFSPGRRRLALEVGEDEEHSGFAIRSPKHVSNNQGTIGVWVNPGWSAKTSDWICPIRVGHAGGSSAQLLLKPDGGRGLFMTSARIDNVWRWEYAETGRLPWRRDAFNHLVVRWGEGRKAVFLDGRKQMEEDALLNNGWGDISYLAIGQVRRESTPMRAIGAYDDLVVCSRALSDDEISDLTAGKYDAMLDGLETTPAPPRHLRVEQVEFAEPCFVVFEDERAKGTITVGAGFPEPRDVSVNVAVNDYDLSPVWQQDQRLRIGGGLTARVELDWQPTKRGVFKLSVSWRNSEAGLTETHDPLVFGVVSRRLAESGRKPGSFFGNHFEVRDAEFARRIGSKWVRLHDFANWQTCWCWVEPKQGQFRWADESIKAFADRGFCILGSLHRTAAWASASGTRQAVPADGSQFEEYVYRTVSHYRQWIRHWEVWNEPHYGGFWHGTPEQYATLLTTAYRAAKRADPDCTVLGMGGVSLFHWDWVERVVATSGFGVMDVLSIHGYVTGVRPLSDDDLTHRLAAIRDAMSDAGRRLPIWNTEGGVRSEPFKFDIVHPALPPLHVRDARPNYRAGPNALVRIVVSQMVAGVPRWMYYWSKRPPVERALSHGSLMHPDGSPMPTALAYATCAYLLEDTTVSASAVLGDEVTVALFDAAAGNTIAVLWADREQNARIAPDAGTFEVIDIMSNPRPNPARTVCVGPEPVFLRFARRVALAAFALAQ